MLVLANGEVLIGEAAEAGASREPTRVAREFKRRLGDPTPLFLGGAPYSAEALTAMLMRDLAQRGAARMGEPPSQVVITHPAAYSVYKLDLLRDAARQAGLGDATFLSEPLAAAIEYSATAPVQVGDVIAMYDFGGGTFDAALVRRTATGFEPLGEPQGLERLGGIDFDQAVLEHVHRRLGEDARLDADDPATRSALVRLRADCRGAKELLSESTSTEIPVILPGLTTSVPITRADFEAMVRPRLGEPLNALRRAVDSAGLTLGEVTRVVLVGGSSRIPVVRSELARALDRPISIDADPEASVARGAARFAGTLARPAAVPAPRTPPPPPPPPPPSTPSGPNESPVGAFVASSRPAPSSAGLRKWVAAAAALVLVAAGIVAVLARRGNDDTASPPTTDAPIRTPPVDSTAAPSTLTGAATTSAPTTIETTTTATTIVATTLPATAPATPAPTEAPTTVAQVPPATITVVGVGADQAPPPMPVAIAGLRLDGPLQTGVLRAFVGATVSLIDDFPVTMSGCDRQFFTVRWKTVNTSAAVIIGRADFTAEASTTEIGGLEQDLPAGAGYFSGSGCDQPAFVMAAEAGDGSTLTDVTFEYQVWAPSVG